MTRLIINIPRDKEGSWRNTVELLTSDAEAEFGCQHLGTLEESIGNRDTFSAEAIQYLQQSRHIFVLWETQRDDTGKLIDEIETKYNDPTFEEDSGRIKGFIKYVEEEPELDLCQALKNTFLGTNFAFDSTWDDIYRNSMMRMNNCNLSGKGIKIALIDTGVEPNTPGIQGFFDMFDQNSSPNWQNQALNSVQWKDQNGHGTAMARIINRVVPDAEIFAVRAVDKVNARLWDVMGAISVAISIFKPHIINMSLAFPKIDCVQCGASAFSRNRVFRDFLTDKAHLQKTSFYEPVYVAAVGNAAVSDGLYLPARYDFILGVGSIDHHYQRAKYSNYGVPIGETQKDNYVVVPGGNYDNQPQPQAVEYIGTAINNGITNYCIGTSSATALATGLLALYMEDYNYPLSLDAAGILNTALGNCDKANICPSYNGNEHGKGLFVWQNQINSSNTTSHKKVPKFLIPSGLSEYPNEFLDDLVNLAEIKYMSFSSKESWARKMAEHEYDDMLMNFYIKWKNQYININPENINKYVYLIIEGST